MFLRLNYKILFNFCFFLSIQNARALSLSDISIVNNLTTKYLQIKFNSANPYKDEVAQVRRSSQLSDQEINVIDKRLTVNNLALDKFLNLQVPETQHLKIALCSSGGGYRATIGTLGSLIGAQDIGLLDCVTYISSLSGSTWALAAWLSLNKNLTDLKKQISENMHNNIALMSDFGSINIEAKQYPEIIENFMIKTIFDQPLSSVDVWGAAILDNLFYPTVDRQEMKLTHQINFIKDGNVPFPIYTAIKPISKLNYQWFEFSPFECGNINEKSYIPTWAFGRRFKQGISLNNAPEQDLSFLLGIFGSAYDISPEEYIVKFAIKEKIENFIKNDLSFLPKFMLNQFANIEKWISDLKNEKLSCGLCDDRFLPAQVCNFDFEMPDVKGNDIENMILMDAGIDFNLPFPPLLRPERNLDVIIVLDNSVDVKGAPELIGAQNYASRNLLKFPLINTISIENNSLSVFGLDNVDAPVVIYMPRINSIKNLNDAQVADLKNLVEDKYWSLIDELRNFDIENCIEDLYCSTYNFAYSKHEFNLLSATAYLNMVLNKEIIKDILKLVLARKRVSHLF